MKRYSFLILIIVSLFSVQVSAQSEKAINLYTQGNQAMQSYRYTDAFDFFNEAVNYHPIHFHFYTIEEQQH